MRFEALEKGLSAWGLSPCPAAGLEIFELYMRRLIERNKEVNLTAVTEPEEIEERHFLDSLAIFKALPGLCGSAVDIGCGAGFPGLPIKIYADALGIPLSIMLIDSTGKKIEFLQDVIKEAGISQALCLHARAEEAVALHRESFDLALSRAVAKLPVIAELSLPFIKVGGRLTAIKSAKSDDEIAGAASAAVKLGGSPLSYAEYTLPISGMEGRIVFLEKISQTSAKYPRTYAKILKSPL